MDVEVRTGKNDTFLTDDEVNKAMGKILDELKSGLGAELR